MKSMRWYPGSKIETFNIYYRPLHKELKSERDNENRLKWKSEPSFNKLSYNYPINDNNNRATVI